MSPWIPWIYHYGVGGLLFLGSLVLALRTRSLRLSRRPDRWLLLTLVSGLLGFMAVHGVWIALATR